MGFNNILKADEPAMVDNLKSGIQASREIRLLILPMLL